MVGAFVFPRFEYLLNPAYQMPMSLASAQGFLSTVASGMMALTGIVFSIAFVMVQFMAVAYSPRLVQWFGRDKVLYHAMGVFIATFMYSLATLVWVDRAGSGQVPFASMWLVVVLLFTSMFLFARLVQRLTSLQINQVLQFVGARGRAVIHETFPRGAELAAVIDAAEEARGDLGPVTQTLRYEGKPRSIARLDIPALVRQARQADAVIVLDSAVGDTLVEDTVILRVHAARAALPGLALLKAVHLSDERTFEQDPKYPLRLLVDIAIRALSPAINDPTTAVQALDQIEDLLRRMAKCRLDAGYVRDAGGRLRLVFPMPTWADYLSLSFDEIRFYGADFGAGHAAAAQCACRSAGLGGLAVPRGSGARLSRSSRPDGRRIADGPRGQGDGAPGGPAGSRPVARCHWPVSPGRAPDVVMAQAVRRRITVDPPQRRGRAPILHFI